MISIKPEEVFDLGFLKITNSFLTSSLVVLLLVSIILIIKKNLSYKPSKFQCLIEIIFEGIFNLLKSIVGEKLDLKIFSFIVTFFIFILISNWIGLLPFVSSVFVIKDEHKIHLFRSVYSDLNMTLTLAIISVIMTNIIGILNRKKEFFRRFLNPVGIFEIIGEFTKIISFSFRLFGNIFAGEILLIIVSSLVAILIPVPFLGLEIFVGFMQAFIFTILTTVFLKVAISEH